MVPLNTLSDPTALHGRFKTVGSALMRVNLNNTHSGNMSCRDPRNSGRFWITASGSPCGSLSPEDLVAVRFSDMRWEGPGRPSSEANTHRRVLELPGINACVHCHAIASTLVGFEMPPQSVFLFDSGPPQADPKEHLFQPIDIWGSTLVGAVPVGVFQNTVGSSEMEQRIPAYLRRAPVVVVKGHGPFACGQSLAQCLHYLSVLENSAAAAIALRRRGVDIRAIQQAIRSAGAPAVFGWAPLRMDEPAPAPTPDRCSDAGLTREFDSWLAYIYDLGLGAFGTGSMSRKLSGDEMLFCPMSAAPPGIAPPLKRVALRASGIEPADPQMRLHRLVYARTPFTACILAASPLAMAEATATMTAPAGRVVGGAGETPAVLPIDAESAYHKVRLPVVAARALEVDTEPDMIAGLLLAGNGGCLVAGCGVLAAGRNDLGQAAYRISLAERMARFRLEVDLNHRLLGTPPPAAFE